MISSIHSTQIISLDQNWSIWNRTVRVVEDITLPSGIYSALQKKGIIDSVLFSKNDVNYRWVSMQDWTYQLTFTTPPAVQDYQHAILTFHGIDTFARITLNSRQLGRTDNMYLRYRFIVKSLLQPGKTNTIKVNFSSPVFAAINQANSSAYVPPPKCPEQIVNGECHVNMIRKLPISFGSEFSPAVPSMGLWKSVKLELYNTAIIRDVAYEVEDIGDIWKLNVHVYFEMGLLKDSGTTGELSAELLVTGTDPIREVIPDIVVDTNSNGEYMKSIELKVPKEAVQLWWPSGYGAQKLYILQVEFQDSSNKVVNKREWKSYKLIKVGFRTIELVQDSLENGKFFYFKINKVPIFMKGANFVPLDVLPEFSYNEVKLKHLLRAAKDANMNMLRVYGGGYYESDEFYSIADDYGLLIWQEAVFPPAMYPVTSEFLQSVRTEVKQNVRRIQRHPSLIHWSTNNQNELALRDDRFGTKNEFDKYKEAYKNLYYGTVLEEIEANDRSRSLTVSSPSNGNKDLELIIGGNPQDPNYGDIHVFLTEGNLWDHRAAPRARFVSEFGFQSLPAVKSCLQFKSSSETFDQFFNHREHQVNGLKIIDDQLALNLPPISKSNPHYWQYYTYASEISQAMVINSQIDIYRVEKAQNKSMYTMGAIMWQLNDLWSAPSWSAIEYTGRLKVLWNTVQDAFYPEVVIGLVNDEQKLDAFIVNERESTPDRYTLVIRFYRFSTLGYNEELVENFVVEPNTVKLVRTEDIHRIIRDKGGDYHEYFIKLLLRRENGYSTLSRDFVFLSPLKDAKNVQYPRVVHKIASQECDLGLSTTSIEIKISKPALFVTLDVAGVNLSSYWFSTNGFTQVEPIKVVHLFYTNPNCELRKLVDSDITVMTMNDIILGV